MNAPGPPITTTAELKAWLARVAAETGYEDGYVVHSLEDREGRLVRWTVEYPFCAQEGE